MKGYWRYIYLTTSTVFVFVFVPMIYNFLEVKDSYYNSADEAFISGSSSWRNRKLLSSTNNENDTVFGQILRKEIPCTFLHEDDLCVAFNDTHPVAPAHFLVIPRKPIRNLASAEEADKPLLGHLLYIANTLPIKYNWTSGYRIVINNGKDALQTVQHLHIHVLAGRSLNWPPG